MLDADLANFYQVTTKSLNQQVKRNLDLFPPDFMFRLSRGEYEQLKPNLSTAASEYGGRRYPPTTFTKQGAAVNYTGLKAGAFRK